MTYTITNAEMAGLLFIVIWDLIWRGLALWRSARRNEPYWFFALLIINSAGILPIIYLLITEQSEKATA